MCNAFLEEKTKFFLKLKISRLAVKAKHSVQMSKKSGKRDGKSDRNKGTAKNEDKESPASKSTAAVPATAFTPEQMANPLFRAALAFRNNPSSAMSGVLGTPEPEEPKPAGPNFMQRLIARAANDANALCILGNMSWGS
jgi:hypothetical protein